MQKKPLLTMTTTDGKDTHLVNFGFRLRRLPMAECIACRRHLLMLNCVSHPAHWIPGLRCAELSPACKEEPQGLPGVWRPAFGCQLSLHIIESLDLYKPWGYTSLPEVFQAL